MRSSRTVRVGVAVACVVASIVAACGDSADSTPTIGAEDDGGAQATDGAATTDASRVDAAGEDATSSDRDADVDSASDATTDASLDAADVDADAGAAGDAATDGSPIDAGADASADAADDATAEDASDAEPDSGLCSTTFLQALSASTIAVTSGRDWTNPTAAITSNNAYAEVSSMVDGEVSDYLVVTDFVAAVPAAATVTGISVSIERRQSGNTVFIADNLVRLVVNGAVVGQNKAFNGLWTGTDTTVTYGGPNDRWGAALTTADVNASTFGAAISVAYASTAGNSDARIDAIKVQIHHTCP
jgi:hypothetical protein